jgi:hypothetical protein
MTPEEIGPGQPYTFAGMGGSPSRFLCGIKFLKKKFPNVKNLCMVSPAGGINKYLEPFMRKNASANGYNIVGDWVVYADDTSDWSPYAAKINANKQADAVYWQNGITVHLANMVKSLRDIGYDKWIFSCASGPGADIIKIVGKEAAQKTISVALTPFIQGNPPDLDELIRRSQSKYGKEIPLYMETANTLYILSQIIQKAQSIDSSIVKKTWEAMDGQTLNTLFGPAIISGTKTYGIKGHGLAHAESFHQTDKGEVSSLGWSPFEPLP